MFIYKIYFFFLYLDKEKLVRQHIVLGMQVHDLQEVNKGNVVPRIDKKIDKAVFSFLSINPLWVPSPSVPHEQSKAPGSCIPIFCTPPVTNI